MRRTPYVFPLASLLACLAAFGGIAGCRAKASTEAARAEPTRPAVHVETVAVVQQPMPHYLVLTGSLVPNQTSDLAANAVGQVIDTKVERGSIVAKGDVLVRLDARSAALSQSEANALASVAEQQQKLADEECDRSQKLFDTGAISKAEYDRTSSQCATGKLSWAAAQARAGMANKTMSDSAIRAPFGGLIAERYINVGEYVLASTKVVTLLEIDPLRLQLSVPEASVPAVQLAQHVEFNVSAYPDQSFGGVVKYMGPALRGNSRDLLVEAVVVNKDGKLRPGMFVTARLDLGDTAMPVVPKDCVRNDGSSNRIFVVTTDPRPAAAGAKVIEERVVQLGETRGDSVAIVDGAKAGDQVVQKPAPTLSDGARVE